MYWEYFKYVVRHKWFVMLACFRVGLFWQGIVHDLSKFRPSEFGPYARHFYGVRQRDGYKKPFDTGDPDFEAAWDAHVKVNPHHWEHWLSSCQTCRGKGSVSRDLGEGRLGIYNPATGKIDSVGPVRDAKYWHECHHCLGRGRYIRPMSDWHALEMICDWIGAGKAQGFHSASEDPLSETRNWYEKNKETIELHPYTERFVADYLKEKPS